MQAQVYKNSSAQFLQGFGNLLSIKCSAQAYPLEWFSMYREFWMKFCRNGTLAHDPNNVMAVNAQLRGKFQNSIVEKKIDRVYRSIAEKRTACLLQHSVKWWQWEMFSSVSLLSRGHIESADRPLIVHFSANWRAVRIPSMAKDAFNLQRARGPHPGIWIQPGQDWSGLTFKHVSRSNVLQSVSRLLGNLHFKWNIHSTVNCIFCF